MRTETQSLVEKIEALPPEQVRQVEDFVDFIAFNPRRAAALDRLLSIAPALEAAGVPPMSDDEIQAEIAAVRSTLRARNIRADRS